MKHNWEKNDVETRARLLSYDQIRQLEDMQTAAALAGAKMGV